MATRPRIEAPWIRYVSPVMMALSLIAAVIIGSWFHYALAVGFAYFAAASYRAHVRSQEDAAAVAARQQSVDWWRDRLESSDSPAERKTAGDLLAYWGHRTSVDPLEDPAARRARVAKAAQPAPAVQREANVRVLAESLDKQGLTLAQVVELRERHLRYPSTSAPLWVEACDMLIEAVALQRGYVQDEEEIVARSWDGSICHSYRVTSGPSPLQQLNAALDRDARAFKAKAMKSVPVANGALRRSAQDVLRTRAGYRNL